MDIEDIKRWMSDPYRMNRENMLEMKTLLDEYPCFTVARMIYLKCLLNLNDLHFSASMIRTAITVPDRRRLYYFIEGKKLPENTIKPAEKPNDPEGFSLIDQFLKGSESDIIPDTLEAIGVNGDLEGLEEVVQPRQLLESPLQPQASPLEPQASPLQPQEQRYMRPQEQPQEQYSEQPQEQRPELYPEPEVESVDPILQRAAEEGLMVDYTGYLSKQHTIETTQPLEPMKGQELIDSFLEKSKSQESTPRVRPARPKLEEQDQELLPVFNEASVLSASSGITLPEDSFTETLARIYLRQKRYDRALEIFRSLSLKYPEKNIYFADQIRFLEKLIKNLKK